MTTKQSEKPKTQELRAKKKQASSEKETTEYRRSAKSEEDAAQSRKEKREHKQTEKTVRVRIFPVWLRIIIVGILAVAALVVGLMIGFGVVGDGTPTDALKVETWKHIIDIVIKNE